jgi:hypothetical protein
MRVSDYPQMRDIRVMLSVIVVVFHGECGEGISAIFFPRPW